METASSTSKKGLEVFPVSSFATKTMEFRLAEFSGLHSHGGSHVQDQRLRLKGQ